jgi:hypothetical protein
MLHSLTVVVLLLLLLLCQAIWQGLHRVGGEGTGHEEGSVAGEEWAGLCGFHHDIT